MPQPLPYTASDTTHDVNWASRPARTVSRTRELRVLLTAGRYPELRDELVRVELQRDLPEAHVLTFHAVLAAVEGFELADDYLDMAQAATPSRPRQIAAQRGRAHVVLRSSLSAAVDCYLATLDQV
jgi:hypothetical protein